MRNFTIKAVAAGMIAGALMASGSAMADGAALYKSKTCIACHGADGKAPILPIYPKISGQNEQYLVAQMKDIKSGARANGQSAAMKGVMHLVNDAEIAEIAKWLAGVK
ncbi:MAG: cytochrome c [Proteobacteria bacterium]|nr:MAG: cytochrome c [Pseudomonadota bacterium]QKK11291.1 MAG: c-type cytochrome [Pseudomonadota bacterium]